MPDADARPTTLFANHSRTWRKNRYIYPVISRRSQGLSIGVNLNPDKVCNFDCAYCSVDRTIPATIRDVDLSILERELGDLLGLVKSGALFLEPPFNGTPTAFRRLNDVAFSGDGEPTSFPRFLEACQLASRLLDDHQLADTKLVVITNATLFQRPAVQEALAFLDQHRGEIWAKLDAGTEHWYQQIDRSKIPLATVLHNIRAAGQHRDLVIQSLFCRLHGQPPPAAELTAYVDRLAELVASGCRIRLVQLYTTARNTAESYVSPFTETELEHLATAVRNLGLTAAVYP